MLAYVDHTTHEAADTFYPGYAKAMTDIGRERGWPPMTRASFDAQRPPLSNVLTGQPLIHEVPGGLSATRNLIG